MIGAAAELCAGLLAACDDARVLATSREPLAVAGEARYRLGPLTLPGPDDGPDAASCEAVALFADRARRADPRFVLDGETGPVVARLVARLDGMPLAIELAALRLANALAWWWSLRGRLAGEYRLLCQAADHAESGSRGSRNAQVWLGLMAQFSADLATALGHFTAVRDAVAGTLLNAPLAS